MKKRKPERIQLSSRFSHLTLHRAPTFEEAFRGVLKFHTSRLDRLVGVAIKTRFCTVDEDGKKTEACTRVEYTMDQNSHEFDFVIRNAQEYPNVANHYPASNETDVKKTVRMVDGFTDDVIHEICTYCCHDPLMTWEEFDKIDVRYRSPMHREITLFLAYNSKAIPFLSTIVVSDDISVKCEGESTHDTRPMPDGMYCLTVDLLPSYSIYWR